MTQPTTAPAAQPAAESPEIVRLRELSQHRTDGTLLPNQASTDVACVLATVHNWVEHVYKVFGESLPTEAGHVALLGVREAHLSLPPPAKGVGAVDRLAGAESGAADGTDKIVTGDRVADRAKAPQEFSDVLYMVWTDTDVHHEQRVEVYKCTVDPGDDLASTDGTPYLLEGKLYYGYPGGHGHYGPMCALHLYTDSKMHLRTARDATKTTRVLDKIECALVSADNGLGTWEFCGLESNDSVHMHFSNDETTEHALVNNWSVGCTVLRHAQNSARYQAFFNRAKGAPNAQKIPYLVVSSHYINTYTEWQAVLADKKAQASDPAGVLKRDKLVLRPGVPGQYVPSIATAEFFTKVEEFANKVVEAIGDPKALQPLRGYLTHVGRSPTQLAGAATNLLSSLGAMTFSVKV